MMKKIYLCMIALGVGLNAQARPVSYPEGWTLMVNKHGEDNSLHAHYSPTFKDSVGYKGIYDSSRDLQGHALQYNRLVKRWNKPASQANFYIKSGVGLSEQRGDLSGLFFSGLALDWEDRRYFTSYENKLTSYGQFGTDFEQSTRVGVAPYIAEYGKLHTWLMLEAKQKPEEDDVLHITPLVRVFKGVHLFEFGHSFQGDVTLNYVYRF